MERAFFGDEQQTVFRNKAGEVYLIQGPDLRSGEKYQRLPSVPKGLHELDIDACHDLEIPDEIDPA